MSKKFLLCFHDFSVWNYQSVVPVLESLKDLAGRPFSVLVIPSTEGADESAVAGFRCALAQLKAEGFELALHGFKHKAEFSQGRSYAGLASMNMTDGEAEFAGLSEYESCRLLQASVEAWKKLFTEDLSPVAFVPPTWFSNKFLPRQVYAEKMLYEDRFSMTNASGKRYASPVVSFAGIPKSLEHLSLLYGNGIVKFPFGIPRIALHPVDFPHLQNEIYDLLRLTMNCRTLTFYGNL